MGFVQLLAFIICLFQVGANLIVHLHPSPPKSRATPVQLKEFEFNVTSQTFSGLIWIYNLQYQKEIKLFYSDSSNSKAWSDSQEINARFFAPSNADNFQLWSFSAYIPSLPNLSIGSQVTIILVYINLCLTYVQFYIRYSTGSQRFHDNNHYKNYLISDDVTTTPNARGSPVSQPSKLTSPPKTPEPEGCQNPTIPRLLFKVANSLRYLIVEVLSDKVIHLEVSESRAPPANNQIYRSPMVDDSGTGILKTARLRITINPSDLSVTSFDKILGKVLTTFSYLDLSTGELNSINNPSHLKFQWTRESTEAIYGIAQTPGYDANGQSPNGQWLGLKLKPPSIFVNIMVGEDFRCHVFHAVSCRVFSWE